MQRQATKAALRKLMNNLDPEVVEDPEHLIIYGGTGKAARNGDCYHAIVRELCAFDESGVVSAPIAIGRDHLDCGSVTSPFRETEAIRDGSDTIGDWPILNAMVNTVAGATWVSVHHGGGVS